MAMDRLYLRDDLKDAIESGALGVVFNGRADVFATLATLNGEVHRDTGRRRTVRVVVAGAPYFAKVHDGVGWREIVKNLLVLKWPVLGARNEFEACRRLRERGVSAPAVAAFGERGVNPATRRSLVLCDALEGFASLEDVGSAWGQASVPLALKRRVLSAAGRMTAEMHAAGVNHRDYYACHLLANAAKLARGQVELAVIDLHRAQVRARVPRRWRRRDLAALLYSVSGMPLTRQDRFRFLAAYSGTRPGLEIRSRRRFWAGVVRRADRLEARATAKGLAMPGASAVSSADVASVGRLADLGPTPPLPLRFDVDFGGGATRVVCTEVLRSQPGRRLVLRAAVDGRDAVLKTFFGPRGPRDLERERNGVAALQASGVGTPRLLGEGRGGGARVLAFEYLADARVPVADDAEALVAALARLHVGGVRQRDLHMGNFLVRGAEVFAIDGSGVRCGRPLGPWRGYADVARLLANFRAGELPTLEHLAACYAQARGMRFKPGPRDVRRLPELVAHARRRRIAKWVAKTGRECTAFAVVRQADRLVVVNRGDDDPTLNAVVADPERAIAAGSPVKYGNTATVARLGDLIIKRFNIKDRVHRTRQKFRTSRARRAWRAGHGLRFAGIPTARPRALIEVRGAGAGEAAAYLVLDHVPGTPLADVVRQRGFDGDVVRAVAALVRDLRSARLSHGDMKASNFVVQGDRLCVLDLDAARFHRSARRFARRHRRDLDRLLDNWDDASLPLAAALAGDPSTGLSSVPGMHACTGAPG